MTPTSMARSVCRVPAAIAAVCMTLSGITLSGITLSGITLSGITLSGITLSGITLSGITLSGIALSGICILASLSGCATDPKDGYAATNPYSSSYRTVAVPIFRNRSYLRNFEFDLAEALTTQIPSSTPYRVTSEATADTILRGTITDISLSELSRDPGTGLANEMIVKVTIDFTWSDLRTGKPIVARNGFTTSALFVPSRPAREPLELARFQAVQQLARDLVDQMQSAW